jgi:hypothetical protein
MMLTSIVTVFYDLSCCFHHFFLIMQGPDLLITLTWNYLSCWQYFIFISNWTGKTTFSTYKKCFSLDLPSGRGREKLPDEFGFITLLCEYHNAHQRSVPYLTPPTDSDNHTSATQVDCILMRPSSARNKFLHEQKMTEHARLVQLRSPEVDIMSNSLSIQSCRHLNGEWGRGGHFKEPSAVWKTRLPSSRARRQKIISCTIQTRRESNRLNQIAEFLRTTRHTVHLSSLPSLSSPKPIHDTTFETWKRASWGSQRCAALGFAPCSKAFGIVGISVDGFTRTYLVFDRCISPGEIRVKMLQTRVGSAS